MAGSDIPVELLKDVRDEIRGINRRLDMANIRLAGVQSTLKQRLGAVGATLLDLAEQQRFVVRYTKARVDKLESE